MPKLPGKRITDSQLEKRRIRGSDKNKASNRTNKPNWVWKEVERESMPNVVNWVVSVARQSVVSHGHGQEPWWLVPGHRRDCGQEVSLGTCVPMPASRPGPSQGVWGEVGEDVGKEIRGKVAPHGNGKGERFCTIGE